MGCSNSVPTIADERPSHNFQSSPIKQENRQKTTASFDVKEGGFMNISEEEYQSWNEIQGRIRKKLSIGRRQQNEMELRNVQLPELKPALTAESSSMDIREAPIALLNAQWLVNYCYNSSARGQAAVMPYRQNLPPEAFVSYNELIADSVEGIQLITLSYMWHTPHHPDPHGETLRLLAYWCKERLLESTKPTRYPMWAVFWDFASLHQHPDPQNGLYRTPAEDALFKQGLSHLAMLYSHPYVSCFKVTQFPKGYPEQYNLGRGQSTSLAEYYDRGWPFVESCWSSMTKIHLDQKVYNITKETATFFVGREKEDVQNKFLVPPMTPGRMWEALQTKTFTNANDDRPLVMKLYQDQFHARFAAMEIMSFDNCGWDDNAIWNIAEIIQEGYTPQLESLRLGGNRFGVKGCQALVQALRKATPLEHFQIIDIGENPHINDECIQVFAPVMVQLKWVEFQKTSVGPGALWELARHARASNNMNLKSLILDWNPGIGNEGLEVLANPDVFACFTSKLRDLYLTGCSIGCRGIQALSQAAKQYGGCHWKSLRLGANEQLDDRDAMENLCRLLQYCPKIEVLAVPEALEGRGVEKFLCQSAASGLLQRVRFNDF